MILFDVNRFEKITRYMLHNWHNGILRYTENMARQIEKKQFHCTYLSTSSYVLDDAERLNEEVWRHSYDDFILHLDDKKKYSKGTRDVFGYIASKDLEEARICFFPYPVQPFPTHFPFLYPDLNYVVTIHDMIPTMFPHYCGPGYARLFNERLSFFLNHDKVHYLCVSKATKKDLLSCTSVKEEQTTVMYLGADRHIFNGIRDEERLQAIMKKYHIPQCPYFICVGDNSPRKNLHWLVHLFAEFVACHKKDKPQLVLVGVPGHVGAFTAVESLLKTILDYNVEKNICLLSYVENEELALLYAHAQALIYPSLYEGFGLPALEAMQSGCPVIAAHHSSLKEIIEDGGVTLPLNNKGEWLEAMEMFYENPSIQEKYRRAGLKRSEFFSWDKAGDCLETLWKF